MNTVHWLVCLHYHLSPEWKLCLYIQKWIFNSKLCLTLWFILWASYKMPIVVRLSQFYGREMEILIAKKELHLLQITLSCWPLVCKKIQPAISYHHQKNVETRVRWQISFKMKVFTLCFKNNHNAWWHLSSFMPRSHCRIFGMIPVGDLWNL